MTTYQLRRYFLACENATIAYLAIWRAHIASLGALGITTEGFFTVAENSREVVALLRFTKGIDPEQAIRAYMASPGFAQDMAGFDMSQITRVEVQTLSPGAGSPLN
ncbi:NIPSNAP family containing protein [Acerihabitans sp. TG2]|uniref:NIPSNAP family containing protein n=1 Tax=Acerihabitans sp. TG2 TaxID=3096008 RepID=UPI002B238720|nr:NIPSNAP family containing protein [Acerihabitans sp. TG2]MEA9389758.1 NIPSNAP family containing protein [Acerihabitans sp. TG2]